MPEYIVERLDNEEQLTSFEARDLTDAVLVFQREIDEYSPFLLVEEWRKSSAFIVLLLPYGESITYMVGEVGRTD